MKKIKIGVLSDTHIPVAARGIPEIIEHYFKDVEMIIHAGDLVELNVIEHLKNYTKQVIAVAGNMDPPIIQKTLPSKCVLDINNFKIGIMHGWGSPEGLRERIYSTFNQKLDCLIYGHSHSPYNKMSDGVLYFNPGSPTDQRVTQINSIGLLEIDQTIKGKLVEI